MSIYKESRIYGNILELNEATLIKTSVNTTPLSRINKSIYYKFAIYAKASEDSPIVLNAGIDYGFVITPNVMAFYNDGNLFNDFNAGDVILFHSSASVGYYNMKIISINSDKTLIVIDKTTITTRYVGDPAFVDPPVNDSTIDSYFSLPFDSIDLEYVENLLSESEPQQKNHFTNNTPEVFSASFLGTALAPATSLIWQNTNKANHVSDKQIEVEVLSNGLNTEAIWEVELLIRNDASTTLIDNFYQDGELSNLQSQNEPLRFQNDIQNISTYLKVKPLTSTFFREFDFIDNEYNTKIHWFNKKLDGTNTDLIIQNLILKNAADNSIISGVLANGQTLVSFELYSPVDNIATGSNLDYFAKLNYFQLPNTLEYANNSQAFKENFYLSEFTYKPGVSTFPANADFNPDTYISAITITKINAKTVKFEFTVDVANYDYENKFAAITLNIYGAKETCLICGVPAIIYKTDGLINGYFEVDTFRYYRHFEDSSGGLTGDIDAFKEDEFVIYKRIKTNLDTDAFKNTRLKKVEQKIIAKNTVSRVSFELDNVVINVPSSPVVVNSFGLTQQLVNINQLRPYTFNETFLKNINFSNDVAYFNSVDASDSGMFLLQVPNQIRWEYWLSQLNANTSFYDATEPNNGLNKDWFHYQAGDWKIFEQTKITIVYPDPTLGNLDLSWTDENEITLHDYASNPNYSTKEIKTFQVNQTTFAEIAEITPNFLDYEKTKVSAVFESSNVLIAADCVIVLRIYGFETGNTSTVQHYSEHYITPSNSNSFDGLDNTNKVLLTQVNPNTLKGECLLDNNAIASNVDYFTVTGRIYESSLPCKQFQDGSNFQFMHGANYNFQNQ